VASVPLALVVPIALELEPTLRRFDRSKDSGLIALIPVILNSLPVLTEKLVIRRAAKLVCQAFDFFVDI